MSIGKYIEKYKNLSVQIRAAFWFLICSFLQKSISMITTPIFTRLLSTDEYGKYNVFNSWYGILSIFITLSLSSGVFSQGLVKFEEDKNRFCSSLQGLTLTLVIFWSLVYLTFYNFWNKLFSLSTLQMLALLSMCWTSSAFSFWSVEQRTQYKYTSLVVLTLIISVCKPILGIILVTNFDDKISARIISIAIVELLCYFYCFIVQLKKGKVFADLHYWRYAVLFNLPLLPHYLSQTVLNSSDRIMIAHMVGAVEAGIYSLAYSASMIMMLFNYALGQTIGPWMFKKIKENQIDDIKNAVYISLVFIAGANLLLIFFAPEVVRIFAPIEYYDAIWVIPPVAMSCYFVFMYDYFSRFEFYFEKTKGIMYASISGAILNIILNYICIKIWGYMAAGYTTLLCYIVYVICHYFLMEKACNENLHRANIYNEKFLIGVSLTFVCLGFVVMATYNYIWARYLLLVIVFVILIINRKILSKYIKQIFRLQKSN